LQNCNILKLANTELQCFKIGEHRIAILGIARNCKGIELQYCNSILAQYFAIPINCSPPLRGTKKEEENEG
jgi:hypothetical protein